MSNRYNPDSTSFKSCSAIRQSKVPGVVLVEHDDSDQPIMLDRSTLLTLLTVASKSHGKPEDESDDDSWGL